MTRVRRQLVRLFDYAAAGYYTLPAKLLATRTACDRLHAWRRGLTAPDLARAEQDAIAALVAAAHQADKPPAKPVDDVLAARDAAHRVDAAAALLEQAAERAEADLAEQAADLAERIVTEHLRPAHAEVVAALRAAAERLPEALTVDVLLRADEPAREAYLSLEPLTRRYTALAVARADVAAVDPTPIRHDAKGQYAEMRNLDDVWPDRGPLATPDAAPWPKDPAERLLWLVRHGAELWMPTNAEREAAWWARYGEEVEEQQRRRQAVAGLRARFT